MSKPRVLLYDIETSPNLGYVWGRFQQDVIKFSSQRKVLSIAYKWLGKSRVTCFQGAEKDILKAFANVLNYADVSVAHNGDEFDAKVIKARMLVNGLNPPKVACSVDTYKVAKKYFKFNSNSLAHLCEELELGKKVKTEGIDLWISCMNGDKKALKRMETYNKKDVILLEKLYKRMLPFIESHPNVHKALHPTDHYKNGCNKCGSKKVWKKGLRYTAKGSQQMYNCQDCGGWYLASK